MSAAEPITVAYADPPYLGQARHYVHQIGLLDVHVGFPDVEAGAQFRDGGAEGVDLRGPLDVGRPMGAGDHDGAVHRG